MEQLMNQSMTRPFTLLELRNLFRQLVLALHQLHCVGIMHRDLKPSNFLLAPENGRVVLKLADFGQARALVRQG